MKIPTKIHTWAGPVEIISFKKFLRTIPIKVWPNSMPYLEVLQREKGFYPGAMTNYTKSLLYFHEIPVQVLDLIDPRSIKKVAKLDMFEMADKIVTNSVREMGNPTHLVKLGPRLWMAANPSDFIIHHSKVGKAAHNVNPYKTICWSIEKETKS